jgi:hypothetical protein
VSIICLRGAGFVSAANCSVKMVNLLSSREQRIEKEARAFVQCPGSLFMGKVVLKHGADGKNSIGRDSTWSSDTYLITNNMAHQRLPYR